MAIPAIEWNEGNPSGTQEKSLGAERIRELKTQVREIFGVDHIMPYAEGVTTQGNDWGLHDKVTFYAYSGSYIPTANTGILYAKDVTTGDVTRTELFWVNETDTDEEIQITSQGNIVAGMPNEIRMWKGSLASIPTGWTLCDGNNGTPNLIDKFVRGIVTNTTEPKTEPDDAGTNDLTLSASNLPSHTHTTSTVYPGYGYHYHGIVIGTSSGAGNYLMRDLMSNYLGTMDPAYDGTHSHSIENNTPAGATFNKRPGYFEFAFIMKR
jgi:hypothetical protein